MKDSRKKKNTKRETLFNMGKLRAELCNPKSTGPSEHVLRKNHIHPITSSTHCRERVLLHVRYHPREKETRARATHQNHSRTGDKQ